MNISAVTILKKEQIFGKEALEVINKYGILTSLSDLAIAQGGVLERDPYKTRDGLRCGKIWSASLDGNGYVLVAYGSGVRSWAHPRRRDYGVRPALPPYITALIQPEEAEPTRKIGKIKVVSYGAINATIAPQDISYELNNDLADNRLVPVSVYTFDGAHKYSKPFNPVNNAAYVHYNGNTYMPVKAAPSDENSIFSNGQRAEKGKTYWMKHCPIEWRVDPSGWWVSLLGLLSGLQYNPENPKIKPPVKFEETWLHEYLNTFFLRQCLPDLAAKISGR
jgi:hypothetical protein